LGEHSDVSQKKFKPDRVLGAKAVDQK